MKHVLLVIIDALASRVIQPAMEQGRLPNLRALSQAGWVHWRSTAIFPSITPAATAALITGGYPRETGIAGAYYYDREEDQIHYYGDDIWPILREGFGRFFQDFLVELNHKQLRIETLYQAAERAGGQAACLNFFWFHGDHAHRVRVPWLLKLWPSVPYSATIDGPALLSLGDFVSSRTRRRRWRLMGRGGLKHRYGFDDDATTDVLLRLARSGPLPELTVAYFPDNDFDSHKLGPARAVETVEKVDRALGELIALHGGLDQLLQHAAILVTGDHAQSDLPHHTERTGVLMDDLLSSFAVAPVGSDWREDDELMVCTNMRAAQIYMRASCWPRREEMVAALLAEPRVDQVIWRESVEPGVPPRYGIATADRGQLEFWLAPDPNAALARDEYGAAWSWSGDLATVDGHVDPGGVLHCGDYPNALERIVTAFDARVSGDLWVTSRVGYELRRVATSVHRGGSHGSLHALDSLSPLIVAGTGPAPPNDRPPRSVDVAPLCREILGLPQAHSPFASHVAPPAAPTGER